MLKFNLKSNISAFLSRNVGRDVGGDTAKDREKTKRLTPIILLQIQHEDTEAQRHGDKALTRSKKNKISRDAHNFSAVSKTRRV